VRRALQRRDDQPTKSLMKETVAGRVAQSAVIGGRIASVRIETVRDVGMNTQIRQCGVESSPFKRVVATLIPIEQ
jgi:hypothetical protein